MHKYEFTESKPAWFLVATGQQSEREPTEADFAAVGMVPAPDLAAAVAHVRELETALHEELATRDHYHDVADELAYTIAGIDEIGEHSNLNDPWANAIEVAAGLRKRATAAERERDEARAQVKQLGNACAKFEADRDSLRAKLGEAEKRAAKAESEANAEISRTNSLFEARRSLLTELRSANVKLSNYAALERELAECAATRRVPSHSQKLLDILDALTPPAREQGDADRCPCGECESYGHGLCTNADMGSPSKVRADDTGYCAHFTRRLPVVAQPSGNSGSLPKPATCGECHLHGERECPATTVRADHDPACPAFTRRLPVVQRCADDCANYGKEPCASCWGRSGPGFQPRPAAESKEASNG